MCFYVFPIATAFGLQADFFSDIQVSSPYIGERLAITYMRINLFGGKNADYSCDTQNIKNWLNDDYMTCTATDTSDQKQQIEFQFDDLSESMDSEIHTSTAAAMCKIFGGGTR